MRGRHRTNHCRKSQVALAAAAAAAAVITHQTRPQFDRRRPKRDHEEEEEEEEEQETSQKVWRLRERVKEEEKGFLRLEDNQLNFII